MKHKITIVLAMLLNLAAYSQNKLQSIEVYTQLDQLARLDAEIKQMNEKKDVEKIELNSMKPILLQSIKTEYTYTELSKEMSIQIDRMRKFVNQNKLTLTIKF